MRKQLGYRDGIPRFVVEALEKIADPCTDGMAARKLAESTLRLLFESAEDRNSEELRQRCA